MWPFTRKPRLATDQEVIGALQRLTGQVALMQERLDRLEAAQERLRGRLYATGAHKPPPGEQPESPPPATNGRKPLLLELGFKPGQPFPHK